MDTKTLPSTLPNGPQYPQGVGPLGVQLSSLADLPTPLRGRAIAALEELETAVTTSDPDLASKATVKLTAILAEIQDVKNARDTTKLFAAAPRASGSRGVMDALAKRAGIRAA